MRPYILGFIVGLFAGAAAIAIAQTPLPPTSLTSWSDWTKPKTSVDTTLTANGVACAAPGGASCTVILPSTAVYGVDNATVYVKDTHGANAITDVLIEVSPDGASWEEVVKDSFDGLGAGTVKSVNWTGHYAFVRVEARAVAASSASVWLSAFRP